MAQQGVSWLSVDDMSVLLHVLHIIFSGVVFFIIVCYLVIDQIRTRLGQGGQTRRRSTQRQIHTVRDSFSLYPLHVSITATTSVRERV